MNDTYQKFVDADQNRIAWVDVFRRFERCMCDLEPLAPKVAEKMRERFYEAAALPLAAPEVGLDLLKDAEAELAGAWPLTIEEAAELSRETSKSIVELMDEHRAYWLEAE